MLRRGSAAERSGVPPSNHTLACDEGGTCERHVVDDPAAGNRVITQTGGTGDGTLFDIWCESTLGTSTFTPDLDHAKVTVAYAGGDDAFCQFVHLGGGGG